MVSARIIYDQILSKLIGYYEADESSSIVYSLLERKFGVSKEDIVAGKQMPNPERIEQIIERLINYEPVQYISGLADFYGSTFRVNESVLIPRPETEELVDLIIKVNTLSSPHILDIGTGSGCIAVSLAKEIPTASVKATDISFEALQTAKENSKDHHANVEFYQHDILMENIPWESMDILVSNPPYVRTSEKEAMHLNVLDYEPHTALFVSDKEPLIFYQKIAEKGLVSLKPGGRIYFEINENYGLEIEILLQKLYSNVKIIKDIHGKDRIASAQKKLH